MIGLFIAIIGLVLFIVGVAGGAFAQTPDSFGYALIPLVFGLFMVAFGILYWLLGLFVPF